MRVSPDRPPGVPAMSNRARALVVMLVTAAAAATVRTATVAGADVDALIKDADRLAWLTNWTSALPVYVEAETRARASGNRTKELYAKFGRLRGEMHTRALGDVSEELARDLARPLVMRDRRLRLRWSTAKGDDVLEWDVQAARRDWQKVRDLAVELGDKSWENRAGGNLGLIAFLNGNTGAAAKAVQHAL